MTTLRFGKRLALAAAVAMISAVPAALAQQPADPAPPKAGKLINMGEVLSGELSAMRAKGSAKKGRRVASFQITSEPRRLPPPNGLCNLETGPETFQLITSDAQAAQLKGYIGKEISIKVDEVACAQDVGQMSEAVVTRWSVVTNRRVGRA